MSTLINESIHVVRKPGPIWINVCLKNVFLYIRWILVFTYFNDNNYVISDKLSHILILEHSLVFNNKIKKIKKNSENYFKYDIILTDFK